MSRTRFSAFDRSLRSRLTRLVHRGPLLGGTLSLRRVTCGKKGCRCARGERHPALYLVSRRGGKLRQVFIPKELEKEVREWVRTYRDVQDLLERLSERALEDLKARKKKRHS